MTSVIKFNARFRYKLGDVFLALPASEVQDLLATSTSRIDEDIAAVDEKLGNAREEKEQLKVALYARFGRSINLEV